MFLSILIFFQVPSIKLFRAQKILPEVGFDEPRRHLFGPETCTQRGGQPSTFTEASQGGDYVAKIPTIEPISRDQAETNLMKQLKFQPLFQLFIKFSNHYKDKQQSIRKNRLYWFTMYQTACKIQNYQTVVMSLQLPQRH